MSTRLIRHGDLTARGLRGACLCGSVRVEVTGPIEHQPEACHCRMCRKQSGHVLAAVNVRRDALSVGGEQHVRWYRSSDKVERGFCSKCGSTLFWKPTIEGYQLNARCLGSNSGSFQRAINSVAPIEFVQVAAATSRSSGHWHETMPVSSKELASAGLCIRVNLSRNQGIP
jgi:hypothetical protein